MRKDGLVNGSPATPGNGGERRYGSKPEDISRMAKSHKTANVFPWLFIPEYSMIKPDYIDLWIEAYERHNRNH
jgi:hypothetical protein